MDVARLLLDHGAQVNMPADSFESPLTLAACGGHLDLAALLISRGANLEEVNDEGYVSVSVCTCSVSMRCVQAHCILHLLVFVVILH